MIIEKLLQINSILAYLYDFKIYIKRVKMHMKIKIEIKVL
jgi:hypothetical protein